MSNNLSNDISEVRRLHNDMLRTYSKLKNKGVYKYSVSTKKHSKTVRRLLDMLGKED